MFEIALFSALITGFIRGGSLERLSKIPFKYPAIVLVALLLQIGLGVVSIWLEIPRLAGYLIISFSYLLLVSAIFFNRKEFYLQIVAVGVLLNFLVIAINGGMPVSIKSAEIIGFDKKEFSKELKHDYKHVLITDNTNLSFLGDVVPLPPPYPFPALYSLGDIFIALGLFFYLQSYMAYRGKREKENGHQPLLN